VRRAAVLARNQFGVQVQRPADEHDGLRSIALAASSGNATSIRVKGKGAELALPVTLSLGVPVTVQLTARAASTGPVQACWSADFASPARAAPSLPRENAGAGLGLGTQ